MDEYVCVYVCVCVCVRTHARTHTDTPCPIVLVLNIINSVMENSVTLRKPASKHFQCRSCEGGVCGCVCACTHTWAHVSGGSRREGGGEEKEGREWGRLWRHLLFCFFWENTEIVFFSQYRSQTETKKSKISLHNKEEVIIFSWERC